jgi:Bacteriophage Mu Gam like protein
MSIDPSAFDPEGEEHQDRERFKIKNAAEADWALRKMAAARQCVGEIDDLFKIERDRLDRWYDHATTEPLGDIVYFGGILREWHEEQLTADPTDAEEWKKEKRKTVLLPAGKLAVAKSPDHVEIEDQDTFIKWALENHASWVRVKYEPEKDAIKKAGGVVPDTGEIAPGVSVVAGELRWKAVTE